MILGFAGGRRIQGCWIETGARLTGEFAVWVQRQPIVLSSISVRVGGSSRS